jgi:hypothetical protein
LKIWELGKEAGKTFATGSISELHFVIKLHYLLLRHPHIPSILIYFYINFIVKLRISIQHVLEVKTPKYSILGILDFY